LANTDGGRGRVGMMRYRPLLTGGPQVSVLGLGCAAMMGSAGRRQSLTALGAALDHGINFFDTARSYGYGASEGLLGEFFAGRRDTVVLCTKFGILPARRSWKQTLAPMVRGLLKVVPSLRGAVRRQAGQLFTADQFSVPLLRSSFETSLRELRTEYVDLLLMHAAPPSVLDQDDLLDALGRLVEEGKVRVAGISGELPTIERTFAERPPVLGSAQFACNLGNFGLLERTASGLLDRSGHAASPGMFLVGNHPFGGPGGVAVTRSRIASLAADAALDGALRAKLDTKDPELLPDVMLNAILTGTGISAVIPAMLNPRHLAANCRVVSQSRFTPEEIVTVRGLLAASTNPARID
jgi:aryl-alcohol dehydrogenase-like predicted oxidoreductase